MASEGNPMIKVRLEPEYIKALDDMAKESALPRTRLIASLIKSVLDDDAAAHGKTVG